MNKIRTATRETVNGTVVTGVALSKNGIPLLTQSMSFYTVGLSGKVKDRSKKQGVDNE